MLFVKMRRLVLFVVLSFFGTAQAGWFDVATAIVRHAWILPFIKEAHENYQEVVKWRSQARRLFDPNLATKYPKAYAYIQTELSNAGIDPKMVTITDVSRASLSKSIGLALTLKIPIAQFEQILETMQYPQNAAITQRLACRLAKIQDTIAHEIGHLQHRKIFNPLLEPIVSVVITGIAAHFISKMIKPRNPYLNLLSAFAGSMIKFGTAKICYKLCRYVDEYAADGAEISRFKNNPALLLHEAQCYLKHHTQEVLHSAAYSAYFDDFQKLCKPSWLFLRGLGYDPHPSNLSRAARFFTASGQPVTQQALAHELVQQALFIQSPFGARLFGLTQWNCDAYSALRKNQPFESMADFFSACAEDIRNIPEDQTKQACKLLAPFIERLPEYTLLPELDCLRTQIIQNYEINCQRLKRS